MNLDRIYRINRILLSDSLLILSSGRSFLLKYPLQLVFAVRKKRHFVKFFKGRNLKSCQLSGFGHSEQRICSAPPVARLTGEISELETAFSIVFLTFWERWSSSHSSYRQRSSLWPGFRRGPFRRLCRRRTPARRRCGGPEALAPGSVRAVAGKKAGSLGQGPSSLESGRYQRPPSRGRCNRWIPKQRLRVTVSSPPVPGYLGGAGRTLQCVSQIPSGSMGCCPGQAELLFGRTARIIPGDSATVN